jgi:O-antigen ligase
LSFIVRAMATDSQARAMRAYGLTAATVSAGVIPTLLAFSLPPSTTLLGQAAALLGWGGTAVVVALTFVDRTNGGLNFGSLLAALVVLTAMALAIPLSSGQPWGLSLTSAGMLSAVAVLASSGATAHTSARFNLAFRAVCWGCLWAGSFGVVIGLLQVFFPDAIDGDWIAHTSMAGRAAGNLRQPNHLSTLLLWSAIGICWLCEAKLLRSAVSGALLVLMIFGIVLSGSRTGAIGVLLLALWGGLDRRLARRTRLLLLVSPLLYLLGWLSIAAWAQGPGATFGSNTRLASESALATTRYAIWLDTLSLIARNPWLGVGFGEFNFAWTLTPFSNRSGEFFDHTHNLPLQFLVELGIPLGILVVGLLTYALWRAFVASREAQGPEGTALRAAFMMLIIMALHSMLEYPLWYAYFLLPTAFVFGLCLGGPSRPASAAVSPPRHRRTRPLVIAGMLTMAGGLYTVVDYLKVVPIFAPPADSPPLADRIASGQRSLLFAHHADYAAATTAEHPSMQLDAIRRAAHQLIDARLMVTWAKAYHERGDIERARYIADRLREFHHPLGDEFFAACKEPRAQGAAPPWQCVPATVQFTYRDFR